MSSNANRSHTNPSHITFLTDQAKTDHQEAVSNAMGSLQSSGSEQTLSNVQQVGAYAWNGTNWERTQVDGTGNLKVSMTGGGDASASNQLTMISSLATIEGDTTSLDGKITACNTGAVVVSSSVLPTGASTLSEQQTQTGQLSTIASDTTSLDTKITACNTGAVVVSSSALPSGASSLSEQQSQTAQLSIIAGDTTSLDTKITTCDTGAVVVSSSALPTGGATSALQTAGNASAATAAGSHYIEGGTIGASDTGVLIMGRNGTNAAKPIHITNNGDVEVEIADFVKGQALMASSFPVVISSDQSTIDVKQKESENLGSANNLANNISLASGASTSSVSVSAMRVSNLIYEDTATSSFDGLDIEVSVDGGTTFHEGFASLFPANNLAGSKRVAGYMDLSVAGITHIRLTNTSSTDTYTNVSATIVGCP